MHDVVIPTKVRFNNPFDAEIHIRYIGLHVVYNNTVRISQNR